jgi:LacI family transcriptional regulator
VKPVPKAVTVRDVALRAQVGVGTVSRVLNGGANVSSATRQRVHAVMREMDFRPHAQARRILRRRAEMVCFLLCNRDFVHSFHARILQGVETCARALRQHVIYAVDHHDSRTPPGRLPLPPVLQERGWVDGLILAGLVYGNFIRRIQESQIPFVALGNNVMARDGAPAFDQVSFDERRGSLEATDHLISLGHRKIAFVGDIFFPWFKERYRGYLAGMRNAELTPAAFTPKKEPAFAEYGQEASSYLLALRPRPTAVVAGNDEIAYGIWRGLLRQGVAVPGEMSLVGFDDREEASLMDPPLTTVRVHKEEIGEALMKLLLERLHRPGPPFTRRIISTELVIRQTVRRQD